MLLQLKHYTDERFDNEQRTEVTNAGRHTQKGSDQPCHGGNGTFLAPCRVGKVAGIATDTEHTKFAAAKLFQKNNYPLCRDSSWVTCSVRVPDLYMGDQVEKIASVKAFEKECRAISVPFETAALSRLPEM